jgi:hypothetical protein
MISLYFNCKITENKLIPDNEKSGYYYPVIYPKSFQSKTISQYEVLKKTLASYNSLRFKVAILNIEIENIKDFIKDELTQIIKNKIKAEKLVINFHRPSNVEGWKKDTKLAMELIPKNDPVLVCMNHDHPYIDYSINFFSNNLDLVFPRHENNFKKVYYYSSIPEVTSWIFNDRIKKFKKLKLGLYVSNKIESWVDSLCVMTLETLYHIWEKIKYEGSYIGRFDWLNVKYSNLNLTYYASPREYFKHYDGYGHVTGMRISSQDALLLKFPEIKDEVQLTKFYYERWLDIYLIAIRDTLSQKYFTFYSKKKLFIQAVEISLKSMDECYLLSDLNEGLLNNEEYSTVKIKIRSHIYYMANNLISEIYTDINTSNALKKKIKDSVIFRKYLYKIIVIKNLLLRKRFNYVKNLNKKKNF